MSHSSAPAASGSYISPSPAGAALLCPVEGRRLLAGRDPARHHTVLPGGRHGGDQDGP